MFDPCPPSFNLAEYVLSAGQQDPDKIALAVLGPARAERWSYARLTEAVASAADGLMAQGLKDGDRVLLRLGNDAMFPVVFLACAAVGLIPVPTSAQLTRDEITKMAETVAPAATVAGPGIALPDAAGRVIAIDDLSHKQAEASIPFSMGDPKRAGYIVFTSGTGGQTRAVVHAHRAVWARRMMWDGWYGLTPEDRLLHAGAFNWTYTLGTGLLDPWAIGATALIPQPGSDPTLLPLLMKRHDVSIFAAAPGVYRKFLKSELPKLPKLRHGLSAGEKLADVTRMAWETATGTPIHEAFGMSECSTFVSGAPDRPAPDGTLGRPQPGRRVSIRQDGTEASVDTPGLIAVHKDDPGLMLGYLNAAAETAARFDGDWFLTGDIGRMDATGAVTYLGRADDMLNAGGYRVSPIEIEDALTAHDAVSEAAAVELRVKEDATVIAAFWVGDDVEETDLMAHACARLASYKCPRMLIRCATLPRGANNKLLRRRLRQDWEAENGHA